MEKEYIRIRYNGEYMDVNERGWRNLWDLARAGDKIEIEGTPDYE